MLTQKFRCILPLIVWVSLQPSFSAESDAPLPEGVKAVWEIEKAFREKSPTRERICLNGLWRWQPARNAKGVATPDNPVPADLPLPDGSWGFFKVPGCWPGTSDYMQKDSQNVVAHPSWKNEKLNGINAAWHQREITIPPDWAGRRVTLYAEYLNSAAIVYVDGKKAGALQFPAGELDLTALCKPGEKHLLTILVIAAPLSDIKVLFSDTNTAEKDAKRVRARVDRRGFSGDVFLIGAPAAARIDDVRISTSVRNGEISVDAALSALSNDTQYTLRARVLDNGNVVKEFASAPLKSDALKSGRIEFSEKWKAEKLWDLHTPQNMYQLELLLQDAAGKAVDASLPVRFGYRELWIDGRDFYLNGSRIFLSCVPVDNALIGTAQSTYDAAKETFARMKSFGINFVYTHNFGCEPGAHLSYSEILRAADDSGMLFALTQPHFGAYDWKAADADANNGYAKHAEFFVKAAGSHPAVVFYSMNHNATGYNEDMAPDLIDGKYERRAPWAVSGAQKAQRAEAIVKKLDSSRIVYHHSSGNLGAMHNMNFYPNFTPIQELSDWFEHWSKEGVKPVFTCEYGAPFAWDWTMYRGWYWNDKHFWSREFGSAAVPWEFCMAEWNSQFIGDRAFISSETEKANLRFEAKQLAAGKLWHRWDYPYEVGSRKIAERYPIIAMYLTDNFRAYRTLGVSGISPWEHDLYWKPRDGLKRRAEFKTDWENIQRPGFSPDFTDGNFDSFTTAYDRNDWIPTEAAQSLMRNNMPLLAYIGGKSTAVSSKDHNFFAGEKIEKQLVIINNSRETVSCECNWSLALPQAQTGSQKVSIKTGEQERVWLSFDLPATVAAGNYQLTATLKFSNGETQTDAFSIQVLARPQSLIFDNKLAIFDPKGDTTKVLSELGIKGQAVDANSDLNGFDTLIVGSAALTAEGAAPDISRVREGLKVVIFEQTSEVLEKRFGFRIAEYGLRQVFPRIPDHPILAGISAENLHDWRGESTILPPRRVDIVMNDNKFNGAPIVKWCGIDVTRIWRCGNRGNVASVLIEKPASGNFLPVIDGGFSLQYAPLMEYREGKGMVLFCQLDVTGRTELDPAATTLLSNLIQYVTNWKPQSERKVVYWGNREGKDFFEKTGLSVKVWNGDALTPEQVLVVAEGEHDAIRSKPGELNAWLQNGGRLLLLGLEEDKANAFLPNIKTRKAEHIASCFEAPKSTSAFQGIASADVHNRGPRQIPLVTAGATIFGDGVLASAENGSVIFDQLVPWHFKYKEPQNIKRTFRRVSFLLTRILGNLGVSADTPLLARFHTPVNPKTEQRWLSGFYLDQPEEWDDPYRFFRW